MKFLRFSKAVIISLILTSAQVNAAAQNKDAVFQVATIGSLSQGVFDGDYTYGKLAKKGDLGLGTFLDLNGEMIAVDGMYYRILSNGKVERVRNNEIVPFAEVVWFKPAHVMKVKSIINYQRLSSIMHKTFNNPNIPYAIRIDGKFNKLKLRSLRRQKSPYPTLLEASEKQAIFEYKNVEGSIVGFWFPRYMAGIAMPGFHLHFIDKTRTAGGHVLELALDEGIASLQALHQVNVYLPYTGSFSRVNLAADRMQHNIKRAEGGVQ